MATPRLAEAPAPLPAPLRAVLSARGLPQDAGDELVETALMACFRDTRRADVFDALYARSRGNLLGWILHLLASRGDRRDPLEVLQDTFVNVYRYAGTFREGRARGFRGWSRTIAANVVRRARGRGRNQSLQALPEGLHEPEDRRGGPVVLVARAEQHRSLTGALLLLLLHYAAAYECLSPRDRHALALVEVEGRSYPEAGGILRVGASNMKMIVFRSRKRIRAHMRRAMDVEGPPQLRAVG